MAELHGPLPEPAIDHLVRGDLLAAIKIIRVESRLGLKDAKDVADNYIRSRPELVALYAKRAATGRRNSLIAATLATLVGSAVTAAVIRLRHHDLDLLAWFVGLVIAWVIVMFVVVRLTRRAYPLQRP